MTQDNDDAQVGWILSRREVLALMGAASAVMLGGCAPTASTSATVSHGNAATASPAAATPSQVAAATAAGGSGSLPSCIVRPALTEGPYFVDERLERSDIRPDPTDGSVREGVPLVLTFAVSGVGVSACTALSGAIVDVWHCDALGVYSDVSDPGFSTTGQKFLRGYQVTDAGGLATFTTIYPGWYQGRTVHIHFKIRSSSSGPTLEFTSQLFFDDAITDQVHAVAPYAAKGVRTLRNDGDGIYQQSGGQLLLAPTGDVQGGYAARFDIGLQGA